VTSKRPIITPICPLCTASHIFIMGVVRNFKFGLQVNGSKSQSTYFKSSLKAVWSGSRDTFKNFTPPEISPEQLKLESSNFVY